MRTRASISPARRAQIFRDNGGVCYLCTRRVAPGEMWHVEHPKAFGLGGSDDPKDLKPAHEDCHAGKTKRDRAIMADADRALIRHVGLKKKFAGWRKKWRPPPRKESA